MRTAAASLRKSQVGPIKMLCDTDAFLSCSSLLLSNPAALSCNIHHYSGRVFDGAVDRFDPEVVAHERIDANRVIGAAITHITHPNSTRPSQE